MASGETLTSGEDAQPTPTRVGTWIKEKYHLDKTLGEGGMAIVYAATHRNKKRFAVKMLRPELWTAGDVKTRFLREGYVANTVDHPGVVAVLDDDTTEDGGAFLVMELLDGESVEEISDRNGGKLDVRATLCVAHQLLDVLVAAHAKNVVHRDLKPANLFLTRTGHLKVLDFGIARIRDSNVVNATNTGHAMGTPAFMAPEQARGKSSLIGPRTDLWSVGATMFSLLSTLNVHEGESAQEVVFRTASTPARAIASVHATPPEVAAIVDRALAFEPDDRWPDAAHMRDAIAAAYQTLFGEPISPAPLAALFQSRVRVAASQPEMSALGESENAPTLDAIAPKPVAVAANRSPVEAKSAPTLVERGAVGRTTEQPVSSGSPRASSRSKRSALVGVGGGAIVVVASIAIAFALRHETTTSIGNDVKTSASSIESANVPPVMSIASAAASTSTSTSTSAVIASSAPVVSASASTRAPAAPTKPPTHHTTNDKPHSSSQSSDFDRR